MATDLLNDAQKSLERVTHFDVSTLPRTEELGRALSFEAAVAPVRRAIGLFEKLPPTALEEFPQNDLSTIRATADQFYQLLNAALTFSPGTAANPAAERDQIVQQLDGQYPSLFQTLLPYISYSTARTVNFSRLEEQGRAAVQGVADKTDGLLKEIEQSKELIQKTLEDVRSAAAEQGVTQQARYFKEEADKHELQATEWWKWTLVSAGGLIAYAIASLFLHLVPGLSPWSTYDALQLAASKLLIFAVAAYVVLTCGRNFLSQKHNAIVNRHRQNALQTFKTLVDAGSTPEAQDIVLTHAAASIFEPQETGYAKQSSSPDSALSATSVLRSLSPPAQ